MGSFDFDFPPGIQGDDSFRINIPDFTYPSTFDYGTRDPPMSHHQESMPAFTPTTLGQIEPTSGRLDIVSGECVQDARSILLDCLGLASSFQFQVTGDGSTNVASYMEPIVMEHDNGNLSYSARRLFECSNLETLMHFFRLCVYLSSNNMMSTLGAYSLVRWIDKNNFRWYLQDMLKAKTTTVEIFASNLLISAVLLRDVETTEILIWGGADVNAPSGDYFPTTALHKAVKTGNSRLLQILLQAGADPNIVINCETPLHIACRQGSLDLVQTLVKAGGHVDPQQDSAELTPLQCALYSRQVDVVRFMLGANADANRPTTCRSGTALQIACRFSGTEIIELLVSAGADIEGLSGYRRGFNKSDLEYPDSDDSETDDSIDEGNWAEPNWFKPAISIAAESHKWEAVQILLEEGAAVNPPLAKYPKSVMWEQLKDDEQIFDFITVFTPLQAAVRDENIIMSRTLLSAGAHIDARPRDKFGHTALQIAAMVGNERLIRILLQKGANINAAAGVYGGRTCLQAAAGIYEEDRKAAARHSNIDLLILLVEEGAEVNAPAGEELGLTALQAAVSVGDVEAVKFLLEAGAEVNAPPSPRSGTTTLKAVARIRDEANRSEILDLLLAQGTSINPGNKKNVHFYLHEAVALGDFDITSMLLLKGADPNLGYSVRTKRTPLQAAACQADEKIMKLLLDHGADINAPAYPFGGRTALQGAAASGSIAVVKMLLHSGANINEKRAQVDGKSAIEAAVLRHDSQLVEFLLDRDPGIVSSDPTTKSQILSWALSSWNPDVRLIEMLLRAGADVDNGICDTSIRSNLQIVECQLLPATNYRGSHHSASGGNGTNEHRHHPDVARLRSRRQCPS